MDLQFCLDSYAVVTYVWDYWSKDESGMKDFVEQAFKEAESLENRELWSHLNRTYILICQSTKFENVRQSTGKCHQSICRTLILVPHFSNQKFKKPIKVFEKGSKKGRLD